MVSRIIATFLACLATLHTTAAQIGPDPKWLTPDGSKADFFSTFTGGSSITLSWNALNTSVSDLWLTHWDTSTYPWYYQVAANINISKSGTLNWYIDVPATTIQTDNRFVLRFYPQGAAYGPLQFHQNASPGFYLTGGTTSSTSAGTGSIQTSGTVLSTTSPPATATGLSIIVLTTTNAAGNLQTTTVTTANAVSSTNAGSSQTQSSSSHGLSTAAQAGIGVGVGILVIILLAAAFFVGRLFRRRRSLRYPEGTENDGFPKNEKSSISSPLSIRPSENKEHTISSPKGTAESEGLTTPVELGVGHWRSQKHGPLWVEAKGDTSQPIEKQSAMVRPGLHELN